MGEGSAALCSEKAFSMLRTELEGLPQVCSFRISRLHRDFQSHDGVVDSEWVRWELGTMPGKPHSFNA